jgi:glycosyltransferase involved in cell wall biosynthesis
VASPSALIQVVATCDHWHGTLQHALALVRVINRLYPGTRLVSLRPPVLDGVRRLLAQEAIDISECDAKVVCDADRSIVVGLWDQPTLDAACVLLHRGRDVVLAPTVYWREDLLAGRAQPAAMLWFVSSDQAADARAWWHHGRRIEVVRCAVDTERFRPAGPRARRSPRVLCRHSRDSPEKFSWDVTALLDRVARSDAAFDILGGTQVLGTPADPRIRARREGSIDADTFLRGADVWVYSHAGWWRETACIAMIEAMATGLPVVVTAAGGMREYMVHGRTGFACDEPEAFVRFTRLLLDDAGLLEWMSGQARQWTIEHHSLEALTSRVRQLL